MHNSVPAFTASISDIPLGYSLSLRSSNNSSNSELSSSFEISKFLNNFSGKKRHLGEIILAANNFKGDLRTFYTLAFYTKK